MPARERSNFVSEIILSCSINSEHLAKILYKNLRSRKRELESFANPDFSLNKSFPESLPEGEDANSGEGDVWLRALWHINVVDGIDDSCGA